MDVAVEASGKYHGVLPGLERVFVETVEQREDIAFVRCEIRWREVVCGGDGFREPVAGVSPINVVIAVEVVGDPDVSAKGTGSVNGGDGTGPGDVGEGQGAVLGTIKFDRALSAAGDDAQFAVNEAVGGLDTDVGAAIGRCGAMDGCRRGEEDGGEEKHRNEGQGECESHPPHTCHISRA